MVAKGKLIGIVAADWLQKEKALDGYNKDQCAGVATGKKPVRSKEVKESTEKDDGGGGGGEEETLGKIKYPEPVAVFFILLVGILEAFSDLGNDAYDSTKGNVVVRYLR